MPCNVPNKNDFVIAEQLSKLVESVLQFEKDSAANRELVAAKRLEPSDKTNGGMHLEDP